MSAKRRAARPAAGRRKGPADEHWRRLTGRAAAPSGHLSRSATLSVLLHLALVAALIIGIKHHHEEAYVPPASIAVVFEHGGAARSTAPHTLLNGPPERAAPRVVPLPLPPPPLPAAPQPRLPGTAVRLPAARELQAFLQPPPRPAPAPLPLSRSAPARQAARPAAPRALYLPTLSFGVAPKTAPAAPGQRLALALSRSELHRAFGPEFAIQGNIGPDWRAELSHWVDQRKYYPRSALEMGQQGSVEIRLVIEKSGKVTAASLLQSSGSPFLDSAWLGIFRGAEVPAFPPGTKAQRIIITATMHYILVE